MECVKCGKEMTNPEGTSVMGISIEVNYAMESESVRAFAEKQMGKYELNKRYAFCYECWLDSLFQSRGSLPF